jgi:beta-lactamase class A
MHARPAALVIALAASVTLLGQPVNRLELLRARIDSLLAAQQGHFALAFEDLQTRERLLIREHELFHAASTMKTPVLVELYRQAATGRFSLDDSLTITNDFISIADSTHFALHPEDDSEKNLYLHIGEKRTIRQLMYWMITESSNLSTNILIRLVGASLVTESLRTIGAQDMLVLRGVEDQKAYDRGMNNLTTAYDLMLLFDRLALGQAVSPAASREMIGILLHQHFNEIIPAKLPAGVLVAHKTGSFTGVHHDSGIVRLPDGRQYVLVILSKDLLNEGAATDAMATVSWLIYQYINPGPS